MSIRTTHGNPFIMMNELSTLRIIYIFFKAILDHADGEDKVRQMNINIALHRIFLIEKEAYSNKTEKIVCFKQELKRGSVTKENFKKERFEIRRELCTKELV